MFMLDFFLMNDSVVCNVKRRLPLRAAESDNADELLGDVVSVVVGGAVATSVNGL
jgi:hypothetical protein